jgi:hypothetical protein
MNNFGNKIFSKSLASCNPVKNCKPFLKLFIIKEVVGVDCWNCWENGRSGRVDNGWIRINENTNSGDLNLLFQLQVKFFDSGQG